MLLYCAGTHRVSYALHAALPSLR
eukprot:COSAG01_NODE_44959_length_414_cov_0.558730_1_plen_23_part_10